MKLGMKGFITNISDLEIGEELINMAMLIGSKSKRPVTQNAGASLERQAIVAYLKREKVKHSGSELESDIFHTLEMIEMWIIRRGLRYEKKVGGLGKKVGKKSKTQK